MAQTNNLLRDTLGIIRGLSEEEVTQGSMAVLAHRLDLAQRLSSEIKTVVDLLTEQIASQMEQDTTNIDGLGTVQRKPRMSSTWIDDTSRERMMEDTINAIVRRVATDPATGEMHKPLANCAREVWRLTQDSFSFTADPKVAFRKVLGLAPDEYRSKRVTGYTVSITEEDANVAEQ